MTSDADEDSSILPMLIIKLAIGLVVALIPAIIFVVPGPVIDTSVSINPQVAFTGIDGRELMIVAYHDEGRALTHSTIGLDHTWVLVSGGRSVTDRRGMLSVVDVQTGAVLRTAEAERGVATAVTTPQGRSVVVAETSIRHRFSLRRLGPYTSKIYLISRDGNVTEVRVAEHSWFGLTPPK